MTSNEKQTIQTLSEANTHYLNSYKIYNP